MPVRSRHLLLREGELARQPLVAAGLLHAGQLQALQVLDDGHLHGLLVGNRPHYGGNGLMAELAHRLPAPLAGHDLIAPARHRTHHDGLQQADRLDGSRQVVEPAERHGARLIRIAVQAVERDVLDRLAGEKVRRWGGRRGSGRGRSRRRCRDAKQGLQAATKNFALV